MRFKIDENLPIDVADFLCQSGHDATTIYAQGMVGVGDPEILRACQHEGRILVSLDLDFADIRFASPPSAPGVIVIRAKVQETSHIMSIVRRLLPAIEREEVGGSICVADEVRLRIRQRQTRNI
jgi:predicted nuclease of predicted toxin-antitoxin system